MSGLRDNFIEKARNLANELIDYSLRHGKKAGISDVSVAVSTNQEKTLVVEKEGITSAISGKECYASVRLFADDRNLVFSNSTLDANVLRKAIRDNTKLINLIPGSH